MQPTPVTLSFMSHMGLLNTKGRKMQCVSALDVGS